MVGFDTSGADGGVSKGTILGVNITFEVSQRCHTSAVPD